MHLTVCICTWNRADALDITLASLAEVAVPDGVTWEVVVANNNSTDHTEEVLDRHAGRLPLTRLFVPRQGKSHALNEVVERLAGDLVLWTDDDVWVGKEWLASYVDAAHRWPEAAFFGGHIIPRFLAEEPEWLRPAWPTVRYVYAARELGDEPFRLDHKRLPFGANMAVRVALQKQYRYDPQLGRRGDLLLGGEETALLRQWLADGHVGMWVPQSRVEHLITADRLELDHVRRFFFDTARSNRPQGKAAQPLARGLRGLWHAYQAVKYRALAVLDPRAARPRRRMRYLAAIHFNLGCIEAHWGRLPAWLKPRELRRLEQDRQMPRLGSVMEARDAATIGHLSLDEGPAAPAISPRRPTGLPRPS